MNQVELICRLTDLIDLQTSIIKEQAEAIMQMGAIVAEEKIAVAEKEKHHLDIGNV